MILSAIPASSVVNYRQLSSYTERGAFLFCFLGGLLLFDLRVCLGFYFWFCVCFGFVVCLFFIYVILKCPAQFLLDAILYSQKSPSVQFFSSRLQILGSKAVFFHWFTHETGIVRCVCLFGAVPCASHSAKVYLLPTCAFLHIQLMQKGAHSIRDGHGQNYFKESFFCVCALLFLNIKTPNNEKEKLTSSITHLVLTAVIVPSNSCKQHFRMARTCCFSMWILEVGECFPVRAKPLAKLLLGGVQPLTLWILFLLIYDDLCRS